MGDEKETRRREVLRELGFSSLREVDKKGGYDRVKAALQRLAYRLEGGTAAAFPDTGQMRRHVYLIRTRLIPGLAHRMGRPAADAYVAEICRDKWAWDRPWASLADDLATGPGRITHLLYTLTARLHALTKPGPGVDKPLQTAPSTGSSGQIAPPVPPAPAHGT